MPGGRGRRADLLASRPTVRDEREAELRVRAGPGRAPAAAGAVAAAGGRAGLGRVTRRRPRRHRPRPRARRLRSGRRRARARRPARGGRPRALARALRRRAPRRRGGACRDRGLRRAALPAARHGPVAAGRQGVGLDEAARHFGISETQLVKDLELLFVCGTPGHLPDDLIEADWESGQVFLGNADPIAKPLRLSVDEAVALLAGLRTLAQVPGLHERSALESALTKLSAAAGDAAVRRVRRLRDARPGAQESVLAAAREALQRHRRLHLRLPRPEPGRDDRARRGPHARAQRGGPLVPRGLVPPVRGGPPVPAGPDRRDRRARRRRHPAEGRGAPGRRRALFAPRRRTSSSRSTSSRRRTGWRRTTRWRTSPTLATDGSRVTLRAASPDWVPRMALRLGGALRVVTPPGWPKQVRVRATAALAAYPEASPNG